MTTKNYLISFGGQSVRGSRFYVMQRYPNYGANAMCRELDTFTDALHKAKGLLPREFNPTWEHYTVIEVSPDGMSTEVFCVLP